jgi:hypothetical protein
VVDSETEGGRAQDLKISGAQIKLLGPGTREQKAVKYGKFFHCCGRVILIPANSNLCVAFQLRV